MIYPPLLPIAPCLTLPNQYGSLQNQLHLAVRQIFANLPVTPLLVNSPEIGRLLGQMEQLIPNLFNLDIEVDYPCIASLPNSEQPIQIRTNLFFGKKSTRLIDWAIRPAEVCRRDKLKLWIAAEYLEIKPHNLTLTAIALHPNQPAQRFDFRWSQYLHNSTTKDLQSLI